ncbi:hypothetical protein VitviT2T_021714 [Vitis vinifera]|uniref:GDPGP1-like N-terminal domain-containing protein n=1 Tax=Vitis vinifera TaxID=29760 RepID=A0ABY9D972_VITVI|nr:hypothetical protein VitviT2T_021714 [Vitis vinifera]
MLTIKRVPTVVSNYQEEASESLGCGRNCLGHCCLPVSKLPLYTFKKNVKDSSEARVEVSSEGQPPAAFLDNLLLGQWEDRMSQGLFRYDVTLCETRIMPGNYGFIAQLNEGRHMKKRPTEFRVDQVLQPFDENKFNFTKIGQEEVLFRFEQSNDNNAHYFPVSPVTADSNSSSVVAINVSPIEYGHVLLIPHVLDCLPQRIDHDSFLLALHMAKEAADPFFRLGYNSLGAFATINHLHFQCFAEKQALGEVSQELLDTLVNPAVWEISGHMVLKRREDYENASEEYAWRLLAEVSLSEERFQEVKGYVLEASGLQEADMEEIRENERDREEDFNKPPTPRATPTFA